MRWLRRLRRDAAGRPRRRSSLLRRPGRRLLLMRQRRRLLRLRLRPGLGLGALSLARRGPPSVRCGLRRPCRGWRRLTRRHGEGLSGLRLGLGWLCLELVLGVVRGRHEGNVGHCLRLKPHHACVDLGIDALQQRPHIEVEQGAVGRHHPVGLGPWGQGIERTLL